MEMIPMRKAALFAMPAAEARRLLAEAPYVHVAMTTPEGRPVLRALNAAVCFDRLYFHGSPAGEKALCLGRDAVVSAEEHVAQVSSAWIDPLRACPATTFYRAVQVSGVLAVEHDPVRKAAALQALMEKHQPEGGYTSLDAAHPLYRKALEGILVMSVSLDGLRGKAKLGQNRTPAERARIVAGLWARGLPGDALACARVLDACPDTPRDGVFRAPEGLTLVPQCDSADDAATAAHLLHEQYWNIDRFNPAQLVAAHRASSAWVGARDAQGHLVASARAVSDGVKHAWVYDVVVAPSLRRSGVGAAVTRLLLDHPAVRGAAQVHLGTRDAQGFYARLGFVEAAALPPRPYASTHMIRAR
jgi:predicted FMN-binding regulatory protein PaiB/ribosomal protein S18 acetylase RimI-like enzyme